MFALRVATLCLCLSAAAVVGHHTQLKLPSIRDDRDCVKEARLNQDEVKRIQRGELPKTLAQNCLATCIWKKAGVMTVSGLFKRENAVTYLKYKFNVPERKVEFVKRAVGFCLKMASSIGNHCELGGYMYKCIMEARRGIKPQPPRTEPKLF